MSFKFTFPSFQALLRWLPSQLSDDDIDVLLKSRDTVTSRKAVTIVSYELFGRLQKKFAACDFQVAILVSELWLAGWLAGWLV